MKMDEQEYQDKVKVRTQLSLADKFRVLEHEFEGIKEEIFGRNDPNIKLTPGILERVRALENTISEMRTVKEYVKE
jgi:hypothetical protein